MVWLCIAAWYALVSAVTFVMYWVDKRRAEAGAWRTRERTLHIASLLGGWPGAFAAMAVLKHKNRKAWFVAATVLWALLHAGGWVLVLRAS